uniref:Uncharacterized protein n=1 Tax=Anopheles melas TaxID=34690 RepID=A0A182TPQ3_9DIPT
TSNWSAGSCCSGCSGGEVAATGAASTGTAASVTVPTTPFVLAAAGAAAAVVAVPLGLVIGAGFLVPGAGETALVVDFLAATPFCCTFRTEGEVTPAVAAFGASEVRVVVVVLPAAVEDDAVFDAVVLASSNGFLAAAVVLLLLVLPAKPLPVVALVLVAVPVRGTDALDTALEGREVTVRVVVLLAVDRRELGFGAALPVAGLALAAFVVLDAVVAVFVVLVAEAALVRAAATDDAVVLVAGAAFAASVDGLPVVVRAAAGPLDEFCDACGSLLSTLAAGSWEESSPGSGS